MAATLYRLKVKVGIVRSNLQFLQNLLEPSRINDHFAGDLGGTFITEYEAHACGSPKTMDRRSHSAEMFTTDDREVFRTRREVRQIVGSDRAERSCRRSTRSLIDLKHSWMIVSPGSTRPCTTTYQLERAQERTSQGCRLTHWAQIVVEKLLCRPELTICKPDLVSRHSDSILSTALSILPCWKCRYRGRVHRSLKQLHRNENAVGSPVGIHRELPHDDAGPISASGRLAAIARPIHGVSDVNTADALPTVGAAFGNPFFCYLDRIDLRLQNMIPVGRRCCLCSIGE